jgi:cell division protein FtsB
MPCPECAEADTRERYVIVGSIQLECDTILEVNPLDCRTYVLSPYLCRYLGNHLLSGLKGEWEKTGENGKAKKIEFDLTRLVKNPIQGLCWVFRRLIERKPLLPDDIVKCCKDLFERIKPNSSTSKPKGKKELEGESWKEKDPTIEKMKKLQQSYDTLEDTCNKLQDQIDNLEKPTKARSRSRKAKTSE